MNTLDKLSNKLNNIIRCTLVTIFAIFLIISLIIKPMYDFNDSPYFQKVGILDYLMITIFILGAVLLYKYIDYCDKILSKKIIAVTYFLLALFFVLIVPLKVFSDMKQIFEGAIAFANFDFSYLKENAYFIACPNNILISIFYGIVFLILPQKIIIIKLINIIMLLLIGRLTCDIASLYYKKYNNIFFLVSMSLISVFMYSNHIYTDIPFTLLSLFAVYLYLKDFKNIWISIIILIFSYFIRPIGIIYVIAIFIDFVLKSEINVREKIRYGMSTLACYIIIFILISTVIIPCFVKKDTTKQIPIASYLYMAFNQEEFGFQDGSHSSERSLNEVIERLNGYYSKEILQILGKKTYWMWMEGTYQAQRYSLGEDKGDAYLEKFEYDTPLLKFIANSGQKSRSTLNSLLYGQYIVLFALIILGIISNLGRKMKVINLLFIGFFIFYLFWEIKSRYIFSLYPFMIMYVVFALAEWLDYDKKLLQ